MYRWHYFIFDGLFFPSASPFGWHGSNTNERAEKSKTKKELSKWTIDCWVISSKYADKIPDWTYLKFITISDVFIIIIFFSLCFTQAQHTYIVPTAAAVRSRAKAMLLSFVALLLIIIMKIIINVNMIMCDSVCRMNVWYFSLSLFAWHAIVFEFDAFYVQRIYITIYIYKILLCQLRWAAGARWLPISQRARFCAIHRAIFFSFFTLVRVICLTKFMIEFFFLSFANKI